MAKNIKTVAETTYIKYADITEYSTTELPGCWLFWKRQNLQINDKQKPQLKYFCLCLHHQNVKYLQVVQYSGWQPSEKVTGSRDLADHCPCPISTHFTLHQTFSMAELSTYSTGGHSTEKSLLSAGIQ